MLNSDIIQYISTFCDTGTKFNIEVYIQKKITSFKKFNSVTLIKPHKYGKCIILQELSTGVLTIYQRLNIPCYLQPGFVRPEDIEYIEDLVDTDTINWKNLKTLNIYKNQHLKN